MTSRTAALKPLLITIIAALILVVALPGDWKQLWAPAWLNPGLHLGLDLAGGTQLDFRISESEIQDQLRRIDDEIRTLEQGEGSGERISELRLERQVIDQQSQNVVEAIRTVLERRINALGVSEAVITPSYIGGEKHLLVECPGVVDVQECIATVGKTIQLEFKEEFTEATKEYEATVRANVDDAEKRITQSGVSLAVVGQDIGGNLGMGFEERRTYFRDLLPAGLEDLWKAKPNTGVIRREGTLTVQTTDAEGKPKEQKIPGIFLAEALSPRSLTGRTVLEAADAFTLLAKSETGAVSDTQADQSLEDLTSSRLIGALRSTKPGALTNVDREDGSANLLFIRSFTPGQEQVKVSHILVAFSGANAATADVTRTKEEALLRAQELKKQLDGGASFEELARTQSDGPSAENAGSLGAISRGDLVPAFEDVAFQALPNVISDPVETPFGYHLIRTDAPPTTTADRASYDILSLTGSNASARATLLKTRLENGEVKRMEDAITLRLLFFSLQPTGWKDTALNGKHFRSAAVTLDPTTNLPIVQILFDTEGGTMFQELTKRNIGKRIAIFVGGELVSAPTVQAEISGGSAVITGAGTIQDAQQLAQDLNTGAIPAPIYLSGQRTVEATLGAQALQTSLLAGIVGALIVMLYMLLVYRFLGVIANIALTIYALIFLAMLKLPLFLVTDQYIVLTLAGAAGLILSIGMAVDTNVLVFERVKEELKRGKLLKTAVEIGFEKAWPSIRDSNIATIITCALLFMIGTSIVRGFAVTLGLGVIVSMFTGMIIARWISRKIAKWPIAQQAWLFPGMKK